MRIGGATVSLAARWVRISTFGTLVLLGFQGIAANGAPDAQGLTKADQLLIVDCVLPAQVKKLGSSFTYLAARRAVKAPAQDCEIRGGEYVAYDRANYTTALGVWLPIAQEGDKVAQNYVGEIYEKGLGVTPDYAKAADWYRKAAEQGLARAQINLGFLYEQGLGVERDLSNALSWYRKAAGLKGDLKLDSAGSEPRNQSPVANTKSGPQIRIIDPPLIQTRGAPAIKIRSGLAVVAVVGKVTTDAGLLSLTINDHIEKADKRGFFRSDVPVLGTDTAVRVVAVDNAGQRSAVDFAFVPEGSGVEAVPTKPITLARQGNLYALIIGNQQYQHLPALDTALDDASAVAEVLSKRYGFRTELATNMTRYQLLSKLNQYREQLKEDDSFLVYYAGHGQLDRVNYRGFWLPVDAEQNSPANWISNVSITDILNTMSARHVLVVSDSCYSGAMGRATFANFGSENIDRDKDLLKTLAAARSRTVMSSGGIRPVLDGGGGKHSVFAKAFLDALAQNRGPMQGQNLYQQVASRVARRAAELKTEQIPEYAAIKFAGHEAGDFVFVPKAI